MPPLIGEAHAAVLLAASCGCNSFLIEGDALIVILAINISNPFFFLLIGTSLA
jgi:hypothetical protein